MPAYYHSVDKNTPQIDDVAREEGFHIIDTSWVGRGFPDRIYYRLGSPRLFLFIEIKNKAGHGNRLKESQKKFQEEHPGIVDVVCTPEELRLIICKIKSRLV